MNFPRRSGILLHPTSLPGGYGIGKQVVSKLVNLSKSHKKIILYASPEKEPFYRKIGLKRMATELAIFEDQTQALEDGLLIYES